MGWNDPITWGQFVYIPTVIAFIVLSIILMVWVKYGD